MSISASTSVFCTLQFPAVHRWSKAKGRHGYLKHWHRHLFHVRIECSVSHGDRQIEFLALKDMAESLCRRLAASEKARLWSCEHYAKHIGEALGATMVEVSEDGENGAVWRRNQC